MLFTRLLSFFLLPFPVALLAAFIVFRRMCVYDAALHHRRKVPQESKGKKGEWDVEEQINKQKNYICL
jgi:hypothetical protein